MTAFEITIAAIFWISLLLLIHNYVGILLYLKIRCWKHRNPPQQVSDEDLPTLTVIVPAHNEEAVIESRITNLLEQDYPAEKLDIIIGSDNSTDRTVEIVKRYSDRGIKVVEMPERMGKLGVIDYLVPRSERDVIVITDANVVFAKNALRKLSEYYSDNRIGVVCGNLSLVSSEGKSNTDKELTYRNFEIFLKIHMSKVGKLIGVHGGFYSFRRQLFQPLGINPCHDDIIIPLEVLAKDYNVIMATDACATEATESTISDEYNRRIRLAAYNLMTLPRALRLSFNAGLETAFLTISYKVLRWLNPYLLALIFLSSFVLAWKISFFMVAFLCMITAIALAVIGWIADRKGIRIGPMLSLYHFGMMNIAGFAGMLKIRRIKRYWVPRS